jgi:hypothetical protein
MILARFGMENAKPLNSPLAAVEVKNSYQIKQHAWRIPASKRNIYTTPTWLYMEHVGLLRHITF